jgi:hypothetical protein
MTPAQIMSAVEDGKTVHWGNSLYTVIKDSLGQFLVTCPSTGGCWGLIGKGLKLNGKPEEFYIAVTRNTQPTEAMELDTTHTIYVCTDRDNDEVQILTPR